MKSPVDSFVQSGYAARLYWGARGARWAAAAGCVTVIVDVMSFSTTVVTAVGRGIAIVPARSDNEAETLAIERGGVRAFPRRDVPRLGRYSLSPETFQQGSDAAVVVIHAPNGARCVRSAESSPCVLIGSLSNASAVARKAAEIAGALERPVAIVACGELWPHETNEEPRFAIEDLLGAGAILTALNLPMSPEALCAARAFDGVFAELSAVLADSGSGRELLELGYRSDVEYASRCDTSTTVPILGKDGVITDCS